MFYGGIMVLGKYIPTRLVYNYSGDVFSENRNPAKSCFTPRKPHHRVTFPSQVVRFSQALTTQGLKYQKDRNPNKSIRHKSFRISSLDLRSVTPPENPHSGRSKPSKDANSSYLAKTNTLTYEKTFGQPPRLAA